MANPTYDLTVREVSRRARSERLRSGGIDPTKAISKTVRGGSASAATAAATASETDGKL